MHSFIIKHVTILLLLLNLNISWAKQAVSDSSDTYQSAMSAYDKGDITTALMKLMPLAEAGDKASQYSLGNIYIEQKNPLLEASQAVFWFERAANQGYLEAQLTLGEMYLNGNILEKDPVRAAHFLLMATQNQYGVSRSAKSVQQAQKQHVIDEADDYLKGIVAYEKQDYTTAIMYWLPLTRSGHADSQYMLGKMYLEQAGERRNPLKAEYWFKRAAELGHQQAQLELGLMYFTGKDIEKNLKLSSTWLLRATQSQQSADAVDNTQTTPKKKSTTKKSSKSKKRKTISPFNRGMIAYQKKDYANALMLWYPLAMKGDAEAQLMLGNLFMREEGIYKNPKKGLYWYEKAIAQNDVDTSKTLGLMYLYGRDVKENSERAIELLLKAARQGDVESQYNLGNVYLNDDITRPNPPKAAFWYQKAAKKKHAGAQYALGQMYLQGRGINKDSKKGMKWLKKADKNNHTEASVALAKMYAEGRNVKVDHKRAFQLLTKAAQANDAEAQNLLADFYLEGKGTEKNLKQALKWYRQSAQQEFTDAEYSLGKMYVNGYGVKVNFNKGVELFLKAAKKGHGMAQMDLGVAYYTGQGADHDPVTAYAWFNLASKHSIKNASQYKNSLYNKLSQAEKKSANRLASEYLNKYR